MSNKTCDALTKIRKVADYQFGKGKGEEIFPDNVTIVFSKKTKKIRYIYLEKKLLATLNPLNGLFHLSIEGAKRFINADKPLSLWVQIQDDVAAFVEKGKDVFAKHVIAVDEEIRLGEEVVVLNGRNEILAVGSAILTGQEMKRFRRGVAVKVRKGVVQKIKKEKKHR